MVTLATLVFVAPRALVAASVLQRTLAKRVFAASELPSASRLVRDILFVALRAGRNPAECGHFGSFFRTARGGRQPHFGPFLISLGPLSPKQPNHGHFGTDVESSIIQRVGGRPKWVGFEKPSLRRSEQGSNCPVQRVRYSVVSAALPSAADATVRRPEERELTQTGRGSSGIAAFPAHTTPVCLQAPALEA
jgi:hypothetical protein